MHGRGYFRWAAQLVGLVEREGVASRYQRLALQGLELDPDDDRLWEPIFVRSIDADIDTDEFFDLALEEEQGEYGLLFDEIERQYNLCFRQKGQPVDAILYRRVDRLTDPRAFDDLYEVMSVGGLTSRAGILRTGAQLLPQLEQQTEVVLGVVDDAMPVLHRRTRSQPAKTRFSAFWSQSAILNVFNFPIVIGPVDFESDIDQLLAALPQTSEYHVYRERAAALYPPGAENALYRAASHGSVVLDLAGGADEGDPLASMPLLAVQLLPRAFDDTSGRLLEIPLLAGMRWMAVQTFLTGIAKRLVINASLGVLAGPKDGTSFLEQQIELLIAQVQAVTGRADAITVFLPYGNAYEDRLVARAPLEPHQSFDVTARIQRDDATPSYVELRLTGQQPMQDHSKLKISLSGPQLLSLAPQTLAPNQTVAILDTAGVQVASVEHVAATPGPLRMQSPYLLISFAPTAPDGLGTPTCPAGSWDIHIENEGGDDADLVAMIQRDDSPFSRKTGARQAYFDHPDAHAWQKKTREFDGLGTSPLTHDGTNSAYSTVQSDRVVTVGGALVRGTKIEPARYTAQGANWSGTAPDLSAVSETTASIPGVRAAGVFSMSSARLSGSSTACATAARDYALTLLPGGGGGLPSVPNPTAPDRLGSRTIVWSDAIRDR
ncbi:MAG: hypothetical protein AAGG09_03265 [Pseudomonadota bacterium]